MSITANLRQHWNRATAQTRLEGAEWYARAHQTVLHMARESGTTRQVAAGVVAALSPRLHWCRNVTMARNLLTGKPVTGVFAASLTKARRIIRGSRPLVVLGGNKVRAFYKALLGDTGAAVIDVWLLKASGLAPGTRVTDAVYHQISSHLAALAQRLGITVASLQATIWVSVRGCAT